MRALGIDAFHFVGLRGGSGGSGSYLLSLVEHLARLVPVELLASPRNRDLFTDLVRSNPAIHLRAELAEHVAGLQDLAACVDLIYAPFTSLPERETYAGTPCVTAVHDLQHRVLKSFFPEDERVGRDDAYFNAVSEADGVLTFADAERDNIRAFYRPGVPVGVVPHAPFLFEDVRRQAGRTEIDRARNVYVERYGDYVLYPAVNWPHKNHYRLIEAFHIMCEELGLRDCKLLLTGAACVEDRVHFYQDLLNAPRSAGRVQHLGFVNAMQLFQLMAGAKLMAFPSLYEGFGIPVLEAMRLGTPVMATDLAVFRQWVGGAFAPFRDAMDPAAMAQDMHALLTDAGRLAALGEAGRLRSGEFSAARMARETLAFLESVAEQAGAPRREAVRELAQLRRRTRQLAVYVLIEREAELAAVADALADLRADPALAETGFVPVMPYSLAKGEGAQLLAQDARLKGTEPVWYDAARPEQRGRALACHATLTADAAFHRFLRAADLLRIAADPAERAVLGRRLTGGAGIDGRHVGRQDWAMLRAELKRLAATSPARLAETLRGGDVVSIADMALTERQVRRTDLDWYGSALLAETCLHAGIQPARSRFAVIETELKEHIGHHFGLVKSMTQAAVSGGFAPLVGANAASSITDGLDGLEIDNCFSSYAMAPEPHVLASVFAEELDAFVSRHELGAGDFIYLHMPWSTLMLGIVQYVATHVLAEMPTFLIRICSADESFRWHDIRVSAVVKTWSQLGARRDRLRFFVESVPLQTYFQQRSGVTLPVLLNAVTQDLVFAGELAAELRGQRGPSAPLNFGYFGEAREEKGFVLLPGIVEGLLAAHGPEQVAFSIQVSASAQNDTWAVRNARLRLVELRDQWAATGGRGAITLHETAFADMGSYYAALGSCDAMLMPYDPKPYAIRGSGVALEAMSVGQPIIVAAGTDMAITFAGPGCLVAESWTAEAFVAACGRFVTTRHAILAGLQEQLASSSLFLHEHAFIAALTAPAAPPAEKKVAIWIGNDVLSQGVSAVYTSQRDFLRRNGYEIYNVYVPFPDLNGYLHSDAALEKFLVGHSLGWAERGFDFSCYSWTLNQERSDRRLPVLQEIAEDGPSFERLSRMNGFNAVPASLRRLIEARGVDVVCVNYVHLLPVAEKLGLVGRPGTRLVLETHDIQAYQFAIRRHRAVDEEDKERELRRVAGVDHAIAISRREYFEIRESCPWLDISFVLPGIAIDEELVANWQPGATRLRPEALELWYSRLDLMERFDLRSPRSLDEFMRWAFRYGQTERSDLARYARQEAVLAAVPHAEFPASNPALIVSRLLGWTWEDRLDVQAAFPQAKNERHPDRLRLVAWAREEGLPAAMPMPEASLATESGLAMEALVLAHPAKLAKPEFRATVRDWFSAHGRLDCLVVGSDHPANQISIHRFIREVFKPILAPAGATLWVVGRICDTLIEEHAHPAILPLGEVDALEPLYRAARVIVAPIWAGAGTPIKVLDGLARGLCVSTTRFVDPALGLSEVGFPLAATPRDMGTDILGLLGSEAARQERRALARRFAEAELSRAVVDAKWRAAIGLPEPIIEPPAAEPPAAPIAAPEAAPSATARAPAARRRKAAALSH